MDTRNSKLFETRKEIRQIKAWDIIQEKESREARLAREHEAEQLKNETDENKNLPERPKPSKDVMKLKTYLKTVNEGRAWRNLDEIKAVIFLFTREFTRLYRR